MHTFFLFLCLTLCAMCALVEAQGPPLGRSGPCCPPELPLCPPGQMTGFFPPPATGTRPTQTITLRTTTYVTATYLTTTEGQTAVEKTTVSPQPPLEPSTRTASPTEPAATTEPAYPTSPAYPRPPRYPTEPTYPTSYVYTTRTTFSTAYGFPCPTSSELPAPRPPLEPTPPSEPRQTMQPTPEGPRMSKLMCAASRLGHQICYNATSFMTCNTDRKWTFPMACPAGTMCTTYPLNPNYILCDHLSGSSRVRSSGYSNVPPVSASPILWHHHRERRRRERELRRVLRN